MSDQDIIKTGLAKMDADDLRLRVAELEKLIRLHCEDSADDDTKIRDLCRPFLTEKTCDHDGYSVVPLATAVENALNFLGLRVAELTNKIDMHEVVCEELATLRDSTRSLLALLNERKTWADPSVEVKEWWPRVLEAMDGKAVEPVKNVALELRLKEAVALLKSATNTFRHDHWNDIMQHGRGCKICIEQSDVLRRVNAFLAACDKEVKPRES